MRLEIYHNDELLDVSADEVAPITKQVNDIGNLDVFKSDFTHEFRVKRTRKMNRLFENAGILTYETVKPYRALEVNMLSQGILVIPKGQMRITQVSKDYFYCSIYTGARDLFALLSRKQFTSLDLSDLDHDWTAEIARDSVQNDEDYQYLFADFSDDGQLVDTDTGEVIAEERALRPFVKVSRLFSDILEGVTLKSDIAADSLFLNMFMCIETLKPPKSVTIPYQVERFHDGATRLSAPRIHLGHTVISDPNSVSTFLEYTAKFDGTYGFSFTIPSGTGVTSIYVKVNEGEASEQTIEPENTITPDGYYFTVELLANDKVRFFYNGTLPSLPYTFRCYDIEPEKIGLGSPIATGAHLPPITQADLVKAVCKFFGLVPDYDPVTNTLELWSINRLLTNRRIARDWSRYVDLESMDLSFRMEYARRNNFKWREDEDVPEGAGDSFITVDDDNLEPEKDLMTMPFSYSEEVTHEGQSMCRIGWFESIPGSAEYKEKERVSPRLVIREPATVKTTYRMSEAPNTDYSIDAPDGRVARSRPIDLTISVGYNNAITQMLNKTKVLRLKFNLPEMEIVALKHYVPVYLEQYGATFFVKRVENWVVGELCNVELIRI